MNDREFYRRLRKLIGHSCSYLGKACTLLEVLEDEAVLILRCEDCLPPIQTDQFGQAVRRASETCQVAVLDPGGENLSAEAMELLRTFAN